MTKGQIFSQRKADTILDGALQEFISNGYKATTMSQVAKTAGVSKATIYSYFVDKENLFASLVKHVAQRRASVAFWKQQMQGDPRETLPVILSQGLDQFTDDDLAFKRLIIAESGRFPNLAKIYVCNLLKPSLEILSQYLATQPYLRFEDPDATARMIVGTVIYNAEMQNMLHGRDIIPMDRQRLIKTLVDSVVKSAEPIDG